VVGGHATSYHLGAINQGFGHCFIDQIEQLRTLVGLGEELVPFNVDKPCSVNDV